MDMEQVTMILDGIRTLKSLFAGKKATNQGVPNGFAEVLEAITEAAKATQEERSALIKRVQELEATITEYDDWEAEKSRYEPFEINPGVSVFRLKEEYKQGAEPDYICSNCYLDRKASPLHVQPNPDFSTLSHQMKPHIPSHRLVCLRCEKGLDFQKP